MKRSGYLFICLILTAALMLASCGSSSYPGSKTAETQKEETASVNVKYFEVPEDACLISYEGDLESFREELAAALSRAAVIGL